ncbi:DMT family transporter [Chloroflexota bacterium]
MSEDRGKRSGRRGVAWLVVSSAAYSTYVVLVKVAIAAGVNTLTAMVLHFTVASLVWWIVLFVRRRPVWPGVRGAAQAMALGCLVYATGSFAFYQGAAHTTATITSLTFAVLPLTVAVLAWLILKERLGRLGKVALVIAVVGGIILTGGPEGQASTQGLLWLGATVLLMGFYFVFSTPLTRALSPAIVTAYVLAGATIFFWLWGAASGGLDFELTRTGWLAVLGLALVPTVVGISALMTGVAILGATRSSIVSTLEPVLAVILAVLILGERPSSMQVLGGALVIAASALVHLDPVQSPAEPGSVPADRA